MKSQKSEGQTALPFGDRLEVGGVRQRQERGKMDDRCARMRDDEEPEVGTR